MANTIKTKKGTVLQVIPSLGTGGTEIETLEIAKAISQAGLRSIVVSATGDQGPHIEGVEFRYLPLRTKNPLQMIQNVRLLKNFIVREQVDLVHARSRGPAWSAYRATRLTKVPFVTTYHAAYNSRSRMKTFYNSVMIRGDRVIAISNFIYNHIVREYQRYPKFDQNKLCLIERGVDLDVFDPSRISQARLEAMRQELGLQRGKRLLLLPGRINKNKGQAVVLQALSFLNLENVELVFLGSDQNHETYRQFLLHYADSLGLGGKVRWVPPASDLPAAYLLADLVLCPSLVPEGFGRVVAEAEAMKKPVIVSAHGASPEVIKENVTGWSVAPGDAHALSYQIGEALNLSPKVLKEIGEKGRMYVQEKYDQRLMESQTIALYEDLLKETRNI